MRNAIVSLSALLAAAQPDPSAAAPAAVPALPAAAVRSLMREALVPGLQVATIAGGRVASVRAFGLANAETGAPVTRETVFEAASLGKPVFAYGVLKLAGQGRIDLDAPVGRYLPDLHGAAAKLTPRQLLSHTGGLANGAGTLEVSAADIGRFSYSGDGFGLLQRAVEAITGQKLDDYMRAAVFAPLGMTSSSYVWRDPYAATKAFGHGFTGSSAGRSRIPVARAQSSLETNAGDYARFMLAMLKGEGLDPAIARQAFTPQVRLERGCGDCLGKPRGPLADGLAWGLGWGLAETRRGRFAWHWGDNNVMQGYAALSLDGRRGVVIFTNSANGHSILPELATRLLGVEAPGYAWVGVYTPWTAPSRRLLARIVRHGAAAAGSADLALPRPDLVEVAERLVEGGRPADAASLVRRLPDGPTGAGELALLAEAERKAGDMPAARRDAEAALRLEPGQKRARQVLDRIEMAARTVPPERLDLYAGLYASPYGPLEVRRSGTRLVARFEDQPPSDLLPAADGSFVIESFGLPIAFVQGPDGKVTHAVVQAGSPVTLPRLR